MIDQKVCQNFQGTSVKGNFQEALLEATDKALEGLSSIGGTTISDQQIEWKVIEISGIKGGFGGQNIVNVSIQAKAPLP